MGPHQRGGPPLRAPQSRRERIHELELDRGTLRRLVLDTTEALACAWTSNLS
jgi:hypothetical protein